ncbi:hypothetical protein BDP27DRAFT_1339349 [Rhodocollybia butyracea]|uniref:Uncharacterized protein n=1 Tax=Rhodocollybia butyracea TaxID=206335 RepID=A0A9P5TYL7_9AGAR|nr:hypothetical protein BDP27DRAFT_1339349 [Rhodocollybia butyracea]
MQKNQDFFITPIRYVEQVVEPLEIIKMLFLQGIYTVLFCLYIYFQIVQRSTRQKPKFYIISLSLLYVLITSVTILYMTSTYESLISGTMIGLTFSPSFRQLSVDQHTNPDIHYVAFLDQNTSMMTIYMIAKQLIGLVQLCRCYHLWESRKSIITPPIILCALNALFFIGGLILETQKESNLDPPFLLASERKNIFGIATILSLTFALVTMATNVLLTALIAGRLFWLMKMTNKYLDTNSQMNHQKIKQIPIIIIESGCLYPATIIVATCFIVSISPLQLVPIVAQTMGIAPTLIMVRVDLGLSFEHDGPRKVHSEDV